MQTKLKTQQNNEYKETELGLLPKEWEVVRLGDVAEKMKAGGTPLTNVKDYWENGDIPLVKVEDVVNADKFIVQTNLSITKKGLEDSSAWLVPENSIILTMYGTPGEVAINKVPVAVTQNVMGIIKTKDIDTDFFYYALKYTKNYTLHLIADRTIFSHFTLAKAKNLIFPLPPLPEQKSIAFVLSTIQTAKEKTEQVIKATKELKKSMMKHLFTYGPVSLEEAEKVKLKETEIGMIPEEWEVVRLGDLADKDIIKIQFGFPCGKWNDKGLGIPHIRPFNILDIGKVSLQNLKYIETQKRLENYFLKKGDVVFNNTNSENLVGKTAHWSYENGEFVVSNHMTIIRVINTNKLDGVFLSESLHKKWYDGFYKTIASRHVNQSSISLARLNDVKIPLPPLPTQQKIASILSVIDEKIQAEENKKKALEDLFKSMLHNLMTAKIRVKDLNVEVENV